MDSLTQIVLGAAVGEASLGNKVGNKAMLYGAIAGTIPDLDIIANYFTDTITATEWHRGFSHSIMFCVLLS
ncbi:MAG: metal-dependent hydrolase, partial [Eudoraea sp.]|nr:metal-dependent hydrolase [Eudoraea sp.]